MKYPGGKIIENTAKIINTSYKNRGSNLENDINISNKYYIDHKIAFIYKKPTPIKINKVDYPTKQNKIGKIVITEAYFESPSTTDYNGIYKGKYIDFEAKETNNKTSFPLENIHKHQVDHLKNITSCGGIGFVIVRFHQLRITYLLLAEDLLSFIESEKRSSIPLTYFEKKAYSIEEKYLPRLDYLKIIDQLLEVA
ncbi:MAG: Holliday junction resolvase RecU [bacterium]|nr:Holliday junction resolvase RecU [bacterium]